MRRPASVLLPVLLAAMGTALALADIELPRTVVANGGGSIGDGTHTVGLTIGQAVIGEMMDVGDTLRLGFWYKPRGAPSGIDRPADELPMEFTLSTGYPNPSRGAMTLLCGVPRPSRVTLVLYDVTGRRVRTLVDGTLNPGYYNVPVRAEGLAGGIYFCSMRAEGFAETRRLILLR